MLELVATKKRAKREWIMDLHYIQVVYKCQKMNKCMFKKLAYSATRVVTGRSEF